jgi:hypothetical protein
LLLAVFLKDQKNTTLQAKDIILALNNEPAKYFDQAKAILKYKKQDYFSNRFEMKRNKGSCYCIC